MAGEAARGIRQSSACNLESRISNLESEILPSHRPDPTLDITFVSGEDGTQFRRTEVANQYFCEEISKVGRDGQVPTVF